MSTSKKFSRVDTLLLATTNDGKIIEIREAIEDLDLETVTLRDVIGIDEQIAEVGETFEENALLKAEYYFKHTGLPSLADDSGIIVNALKGELGVHTRRFGAGPEASDAEWVRYFLDRMQTEEEKRATFVCVLALVDESGKYTFEGRCEGVITEELEAEYLPGLPISACFMPSGFDKVFSALTLEEKNQVSHRGKAMKKLRDHIKKLQGYSRST